mgnify:CR=1 FL=1
MQGVPGRQPMWLENFAWHLPCTTAQGGLTMDLVFVLATVVFFAVSLAYVRGCDRL